MNNGISFKFNFETNNHEEAHNILPVIMEKLKMLQDQNATYRYMELNLLQPARERKTACLTVYNQEGVIREESREEDWANAVDAVFNQVREGNNQAIKLS